MDPAELHQCAAIFRSAADASTGIVVRTDDAARARVMLYEARKLLGDVEFNQLMIRVSPDDTEHELWIIRNAAQLLDLKATEILDA